MLLNLIKNSRHTCVAITIHTDTIHESVWQLHEATNTHSSLYNRSLMYEMLEYLHICEHLGLEYSVVLLVVLHTLDWVLFVFADLDNLLTER